MLTLNVNGKNGSFTLNLPTKLNEITKEYITDVTSHIKPDANYTVVGLIFREKLSTLALAARKNKKNSDIAVIPIFVKSGDTNSDFINSLNVSDKLIISPSDIMMGYHLSTPNNLLTINTILDVLDGDVETYNKLIGIQEQCYFIEFKLVPNCNIHGAYTDVQTDYKNNFVIKTGNAKKSDIILPEKTKFIV